MSCLVNCIFKNKKQCGKNQHNSKYAEDNALCHNKADIEAEMHRMLGTTHVFWLGSGIEGDDTDGHIDDMVRFVNPEAVVSIVEPDPHSPHYRALAENNERLQALRTPSGHRVEIIPLPMPQPLVATVPSP